MIKKDAKEAFRKHVSSKKLVPEIFKNKRHIDEIKGVYVPFWLFDASVDADISYRGERTRVWTDREYRYEEHNYYSIFRSGNVVFDNVPVDGSKKMPDDLMESLEPYDFKEAVDFKSAYLAGFMADRYDVGVQESIEKANMRIKMSTEEMFLSTVDGFGNVLTERSYIRLNNGIAKYALYPVWLLNTKWEGNIYTFAMNGQTGKFIGDLPLDKRAFWRKFGVLAGIFSVVGCVFVSVGRLSADLGGGRDEKKRLLLIFMTCLLALGNIVGSSFRRTIGGMYYSDETGVLSSDEWDSVNDELQIISEDQECDVFIQVADDFGSMTPTEYADNVYEEKGVGYGVDRSGIVLVVNYDSGEWAISTAGYGITAFTDAGQTYIMDQVAPMLRDDPSGAFMKFADLAEDFLIKANAGGPL